MSVPCCSGVPTGDQWFPVVSAIRGNKTSDNIIHREILLFLRQSKLDSMGDSGAWLESIGLRDVEGGQGEMRTVYSSSVQYVGVLGLL